MTFCWGRGDQGRIMVPPGPEARKRLRAPRTYTCNIDVILVLFLLLPPLFRNVVYVKKHLFLHMLQNNASWNAFYVEQHLNINIVYSKVLQLLSKILTNHCDKTYNYNLEQTMTYD